MRSPRLSIWLLSVLLLGGSLSVYAQRDVPPSVTRPTNEVIRYSVTLVGERAILLDGASGQTWWLSDSPDKTAPPAWLLLQRFDDSDDAILSSANAQLKVYERRFPPTHHKIRELQDTIKRHSIDQDASESSNQVESSIVSQLYPLMLEEQNLLETHGPDHPEVLRIRNKIELLRQFLTQEQPQ